MSIGFVSTQTLHLALFMTVHRFLMGLHAPKQHCFVQRPDVSSTFHQNSAGKTTKEARISWPFFFIFFLAVGGRHGSVKYFLAFFVSLLPKMFRSRPPPPPPQQQQQPRSLLAHELRQRLLPPIPVPLPQLQGSGQLNYLSTSPYYAAAVDRRYLPTAIISNEGLIPHLLRSFYAYCEQHPTLGSDAFTISAIRHAREQSGRRRIHNEATTSRYLTTMVIEPVTSALHALEENDSLRNDSEEVPDLATGAHVDMLWLDDSGVRAVWEEKGPEVGERHFPAMDRKARERFSFDHGVMADFQDADSIIVKVQELHAFLYCYYCNLTAEGAFSIIGGRSGIQSSCPIRYLSLWLGDDCAPSHAVRTTPR
jgi:hypothetical protein